MWKYGLHAREEFLRWLFNIVSATSDHNSIKLVASELMPTRRARKFCFENSWLAKDDFGEVINSSSWECPSNDVLIKLRCCWSILGTDVFNQCCSWLDDGAHPNLLNETLVVLIPNKDKPDSLKDLWLIALCNVLHKITTKSLANRLKENSAIDHLFIAIYFCSGCLELITENILIVFELIHHMKNKGRGKVGKIALKLDVSKAYDQIDWNFLQFIM
ncbi:hypothetical protein J1N35_032812 [Gossypium stocksii]|uniref:Reverse transcriptase domain-containing protein n=1 Tax=Gossypium stocksii TaxID=47602 RepID=A0A9D3ZWL4_9ROSI|nr:hypothetical protein J1N35_032812 [Gossypium stocksii]